VADYIKDHLLKKKAEEFIFDRRSNSKGRSPTKGKSMKYASTFLSSKIGSEQQKSNGSPNFSSKLMNPMQRGTIQFADEV
jgi:hypothetical protein